MGGSLGGGGMSEPDGLAVVVEVVVVEGVVVEVVVAVKSSSASGGLQYSGFASIAARSVQLTVG